MLNNGHGSWSRFGLIVAMALPPSVTAYYQHVWVGRHLLLAAGALVGYEVVVAAIGLVGQVWGNLRTEWARRLSDSIDQVLLRRFSGFERRYRENILQSHRFIDEKGLATLGEHTPELDDVFVDVSLAPRSPQLVSGDVLSEPPSSVPERHSIWDFLNGTSPSPVVLAIIGAPGSGKTTLLRHTAARLSGSRRRRGLPVLLLLRESVGIIADNPDVGLPEVIRRQTEGSVGKSPSGWFEHALADGRCVVMLDGLDEVAREEDRRSVVDWVDRQIARYPGNDYVITSRPHGYGQYSLARAIVLQVRRFTPAQITRFVHGWYLAVERHRTGAASEHVERKSHDEADDLLGRLAGTPALLDLAANPLLLTMISNVHRYRGALPGTRAELYAEMCLVLLGRRQEAKRLADPLRAEQKELVLRELAFIMMQQNVRDIPEERMVDVIRRVLPRFSSSLTTDDFLADIRANGLLLELEREIYCFAHHTFQEYLAAAHIRARGLHKVLEQNVANPWWRETILLYVARADAGPIIEACLASGELLALSLAFECAEAASELAPEMRSRLDALLSAAAEQDASPERHRLAATVISARQFRRTIRLEDGTQICTRPVSCDLYSLFAQDEMRAGRNRMPDSNDQTPLGEPALGIRAGADATAFVEWLNRLLQDDVVCRLPAPTEAGQLIRVGNPALGEHPVWTATGTTGDPHLWVPPGCGHPYAVTEVELQEQVNADVGEPILHPILHLVTSLMALSLAHTLAYAHTLALAIDRDLRHDAGPSRDHRYALGRVLSRGGDLNDQLNLIRGDQFAPALDTAMDRYRRQVNLLAVSQSRHDCSAIAHDLARDLARVRQRSRDLGIGLVLDDQSARFLGLDRGSFLDLDARTLDNKRPLDLTDLELDRELDHKLNPISIRGYERAQPLFRPAEEIAAPSNADFDLAALFVHARSWSLIAGSGTDHDESWQQLLSHVPAWVILPDLMYRRAGDGHEQIVNRPDEDALGRRAVNVAKRILDLVSAVRDRKTEITPHSASEIRLGALALAGSAKTMGLDASVAQIYMEIAIGITALQRRMASEAKPDETIVLVRI
jgi:NACHT domain